MPTYEFSPSINNVDYTGSDAAKDKIDVVVTDDGTNHTFATSLRLSGSDNIIPNGAPDGKDTLSISASVNTSTLAVSADLSYNSLAGGADDNKLSLTANGNSDSFINGNSLSATDGKDSFTLTAKTKGGFGLQERVEITNNMLTAGDGANKITVKAETTGDDAYVAMNHITTGSGKDSLNFSLKTAGNDGDVGGADAVFGDNFLTAGDGANQIKVDVQSGGDDAGIIRNSVTGGDSTDKLTFSAKTAGNFPAEAGGDVANADAYFSMNTLLTDEGKDSIKVTAQSGNDDATFEVNSIDTGDENDNLSVTLKTSAKGPIADSGGASVYASNNSIHLGDGDDKLTIKAQTAGDDVYARNNIFAGGLGNDTLQIALKTTGKAPDAQGDGAMIRFDKNILATGIGQDAATKDVIKVTGQTTGADAYFFDNALIAADSDAKVSFDINFKTSAKDPGTDGYGANVYFLLNEITGDAGESHFKFNGQTAGDDATFVANDVTAASGATTLEVKLKTTGKAENTNDQGYNGADALVSQNSFSAMNSNEGPNEFTFDVQSGGDDALFVNNDIGIGGYTTNLFDISLKTSGKVPSTLDDVNYDGGDASFNKNSLYSSTYGQALTVLTAKIESGGDDATFDMNTLKSGTRKFLNVTTEVKATGKSEDFGGADASISNNSLYSGYLGSLTVDFTAESKNGDASIDGNRFTTIHDAVYKYTSDTLSFTAKAGKAGIASISDNNLYTGPRVVTLDFDLAAKGTGEFMDNTLNLGNNDDQLSINLSAKDSLTFTGNQIISGVNNFYGGNSDDEIILKIKAAEGSDLSGNTFSGEGYYTYDHTAMISLDIDTKLGADEIETFLDGNTFNGGNHVFDTLSFANKGQMIDLADVADNLNRIDHLALGKKSMLIIDSAQNVIDSSDSNLLVSGKGSTVDIDTTVWTNDGAVEYQGYQTTHFSNGTANLYVADGVDVI